MEPDTDSARLGFFFADSGVDSGWMDGWMDVRMSGSVRVLIVDGRLDGCFGWYHVC